MTIEEYQAKIDGMEKRIFDALGPEKAYEEINKALGYDTRKDIYEYIIRMWDLDYFEGAKE